MQGTLALLAIVALSTQQHVVAQQVFDCANWNANYLRDNSDLSSFCGVIDCGEQALGEYSIPAELGGVTVSTACPEIPIFLFVNVSDPLQPLTGQLPASLSSLAIDHILTFRKNQLTGSIPSSVRSNAKLVELDLEENTLTGSLSDYITGWSASLTKLLLKGNEITGNYDDPALLAFLSNAQKLTSFSITLNNQNNGCLSTQNISKARSASDFGEVFIDIPDEFICPWIETLSPTITGFTAAPSSPTESPTKFPTFEAGPEPTKGPTPEPTPSPTPPFPTNRPTTVPPRTLPPTNAAPTLRLSIISICIAAIFIAMTRQ